MLYMEAVAKDEKERCWVRGGPAFKSLADRYLCGYCAIPKAEVPKEWHGDYDADGLGFLNVHGGITYCQMNGADVVFGFDCGHLHDEEDSRLRDPAYVLGLAVKMAAQIRGHAAHIQEWRAANRSKRAEMLDELVASSGAVESLGFGAMIALLGGAKELGEE